MKILSFLALITFFSLQADAKSKTGTQRLLDQVEKLNAKKPACETDPGSPPSPPIYSDFLWKIKANLLMKMYYPIHDFFSNKRNMDLYKHGTRHYEIQVSGKQ